MHAVRGVTRVSIDARVKPGGEHGARVLVADDDVLARNALREALVAAGLSVVGQASDSPQAINLAARCLPDVVVMDAELPPSGAVETMGALVRAAPGTSVVLLAIAGDDEAGLVALAHGAAGYLSRGIDLRGLARAVRGVAAGEAAISRRLTRRLIERFHEQSHEHPGLRPIRSPLTTREWEVLDLMASGVSTRDMARELVVSPDTVNSHVHHILRKLHARSRAEAVVMAQRARHHGNGSVALASP
jgi:two-component system, NarL family, response regulator LiaR